MQRHAVVAIVLASLLPGAALAAAPWSEPETLSKPHLFVASPGVAFTGDGTAVATWGWQDGTKIATATTGSRVAYRPAGGVWSAERTIRGDVAEPPVTFGARGWAVPTQTLTASDRTTIGVVMGTAGRTPDRPLPIFRGRTLARVQLAGNARGRLALAWQQRAGGRGRAYVALRRPGSRFGRPRVVADGRVRNVAVAVGPRGDVLVAWEERGSVRAKILGRRAHTIGSLPAFTVDLRAELTSGGANIAWTAQRASEGDAGGPVFVQASRNWRDAQLLERLDGNRGIRGLALDGGRVAWVGHDGTDYVVRTATVGAAPQDLPGGRGDFAVDDLSGDTLVLTRFFGSDADTGSQVMASHALGPPVAVSAEQEAYGGRAAADPRGGVTTVWVNRPEGSRHPVDDIRTVVQSASRP